MDQDNRAFFSGDSLEQAVMLAARHYSIEPEELLYERYQKTHGFIRSRRRVVIRVDPENYRRPATRSAGGGTEPEAAPLPERQRAASEVARSEVEGRDVRSARASGPIAEEAEQWLEALASLAHLDLSESAVYHKAEGELEIDVAGPDAAVVVEDEGQVLLSLQSLLPRLLMGSTGETVRIRVDCEEYRRQREVELREMAERTASEVRQRRHAKTLRPMHPADRRVVHLALQDDPAVTTESVGEGYFKRVKVSPIGG